MCVPDSRYGEESCFSITVYHGLPRSFRAFSNLLRICQNLFHACPLEAGLTLMMGGRTVAGGSRARLTAEGSAQVPRARGNTQGPGAMDLRFLECTPGPVGTVIKERGRRERGMASVWRPKASGSTRGSGHKDSRVATEGWKASAAGLVMKGPGVMAYRMVMVLRHTLMEVRKINITFIYCVSVPKLFLIFNIHYMFLGVSFFI